MPSPLSNSSEQNKVFAPKTMVVEVESASTVTLANGLSTSSRSKQLGVALGDVNPKYRKKELRALVFQCPKTQISTEIRNVIKLVHRTSHYKAGTHTYNTFSEP